MRVETLLLVLLLAIKKAGGQPDVCVREAHRRKFDGFPGKRLSSHIIDAVSTRSVFECGSLCLQEDACTGYNYKHGGLCELVAPPADYSLDSNAEYKHYRVQNPFTPESLAAECGYPADCAAYYAVGMRASGVYHIKVPGMTSPVPVYCELSESDGVWTRVQRRQDGSVDFIRNWANFTSGFGNIAGEHWLGNAIVHALTNSATYRLKIDITLFDDSAYFAKYENFLIKNEANKFQLSISGYTGNVGGDAFTVQGTGSNDDRVHGAFFSTLDMDNDNVGAANCAGYFGSAWWANNCFRCTLNGPYAIGGTCSSPVSGGNCIAYQTLATTVETKEVTLKIQRH